MKEMLPKNEKSHSYITDDAANYVYTVRLKGGRPAETNHSEACFSVTGYTSQEFVNDPDLWIHMVIEEDRDIVRQQAEDVLSGKLPLPIIHRILRKDGVVRWIENTVVPNKGENENLISYNGIIHDITERKNMENELQKSKEKFYTVFNSSPNLMAITNLQKRTLVDVNESFINTLGYSREELIGKRTEELGLWVKPEQRMSIVAELQKKKRINNYDIQLRTKSGEILQFLSSAEIINLNNEPHLITTASDITDRSKGEVALKESEKRFRGTLEHANLIAVQLDRSGIITFANNFFLKLTGWDLKDILGKEWMDIFVPDDIRDDIRQLHRDNIPNRKVSIHNTNEIITKNGEKRLISWNNSHLFDFDGNIISITSIGEDITERKKMEDALQESEERFRMMMHQSPSVIELYNIEGLQIEVNEAYEKLWGFPASHTVKKFNVLKSKEVEETGLMTYVKEAYAGKSIKVPEYKFDSTGATEGKGKGRIRWLSTRIYPLKDRAGNVKNIVITHEDISDIKFAEEERAKLKAELQHSQKIESIGILAGGIAHDFNNLLAAIRNNIYMTKMRVARESMEYENMESAENAIKRAVSLTHQLLTFSEGGAPIKKTAFINEIIEESAEFVLRGSNVKCGYKAADNLWTVEVDEGQMSQVIHNLVLNADQAMPEGGTIHIITENTVLAPDTGLPLQEGRYVKIVIQDEGVGIAEEHLQKLFDPYFTTKEMGRGLGLSISYSVVKQHEGYISAESELGVGTTFTIYLPASEKQIEEKETVEDTFVAGEGKVLIMDDEEIIRETSGELLTYKGYKVECAKDGDEAIELYKHAMESSQPFDAVILDLTIRGGMGGKETVKKLLEIDPGVKAIVSSGYSNDPVLANFREYGFCGVFAKHDKVEELGKVVHKVINRNH
jgi:PAS domain S-box-containing protein